MARSIVLAKHVDEGMPPSDAFTIKEAHAPDTCNDGECILKLLFLSADPYMRNRMCSVSPGYISNFKVGETISGFVVAEVVVSKCSSWAVGDLCAAMLPYTTVQVVRECDLGMSWKLNEYCTKENCSLGVGLFGMPGMTAYFGLDRVLHAKEGETLFVNAAAGVVGGLVGQLAKARGCRVVGSAGGPSKTEVCLKNGFDAMIDYKEHTAKETFHDELKKSCPKGIDMFFENVGGYQWNATFPLLNIRSRVAICGCIDSYNNNNQKSPPSYNDFHIGAVLTKSITIQGFLVFQWMGIPEERRKALSDLSEMYKSGTLKCQETVLEGIDKFGDAMQGLFTGANIGKMVVKVL